MILVDTSIWIDHLHRSHPVMDGLLMEQQVIMHPFVFGEIAMGSIRKRSLVLGTLSKFKAVRTAREEEVLNFTAAHKLFGRGIGYIDVHLLASVQMTPGTMLWTRDKRLHAAALDLDIAYQPRPN
jgi:predicted nucleic acid-binding protein